MDDGEYWPKAACDYCEYIGYAPVDMQCGHCGGPMFLMTPIDKEQGNA